MKRNPVCAPPNRRAGAAGAMSGMTLIELMVALAIFAVLGVICVRVVTATTESRQRLADALQRWGEITRLLQMTESDLMQIVARPASSGGANPPSMIVVQPAAGAATEFSFIKLDGGRNTVRRRGYRLEGDRVVLLRWSGVDMGPAPARDVVLENVKALRVSLITAAGRRSAFWPPDHAAADTLPAAIELELELPDAGTIRRLFALR